MSMFMRSSDRLLRRLAILVAFASCVGLAIGQKKDLFGPNFFSPLKHHKGIVHCNTNNLINTICIELIR